MAFKMCVQREHVHFATSSYFANVEGEASLWWENEWVNTGAVDVYSVFGSGYSFLPAVGASPVTDEFCTRVAI
ncbi:nitrilase [Colletotrichum higginsianum]|nr:nitrilase [Colletotrichum higginsianum]